MCLIVVGWRVHPDFPLVVAANRDEFHARPTAVANFWANAPEVIAGRDLEAGGTWLGITRSGRFAAVTNVREPGAAKGLHSRGRLTQAFLEGRQSAADHVGRIEMGDYSGFNLLVGDGQIALVLQQSRREATGTGAGRLWPFESSAGQPVAEAADSTSGICAGADAFAGP